MRAVDINQQIFVPVVDETHGGVTVEMKMTVGEFFGKCCQGFEPEVVEAIPVEWIVNLKNEYAREGREQAEGDLMNLLLMWQKEQEAQNG